MEFKDRLKELRTRRGISQKELADRLHISGAAVSMLESGARTPSRERLSQRLVICQG